MPPTKAKENGSWAGSKKEWSQRAGPHNVTLNSGMRITFRILGLQTLIRMDALPEELTEAVVLHMANLDKGGLEAVIGAAMSQAITDPKAAERALELTRNLGEITKHLVAAALVSPKLTFDELSDPDLVPEADLEELMRLCTGRQAFDSRGVRIGVEPLDVLARFRYHHSEPRRSAPCLGDESCPACRATIDDMSSVHMGGV